ncbi:hypothetical protein I302_102353 [Kwoniella bestiolae CBS 10118]|uniref:Uncharacterized protein n=1 Tax=Kwoniella bestiolae CBS 10118 TaxID=1296100 RepID=A0A1B9GEZ1_9TREE|nr:hypothetical protein I302_01046 [Kwoniella bestiolae CBS 10118]OCF29538.1 hypothetical protein I302_01046 [Kwoniella bestiolae CBS 10118]
MSNPNSSAKSSISQSDRHLYLSTLYHLLSRLKSSESTICPSQIPRALHDSDPAAYPDWRGLMDPVREVVWDEVREGRVEVTQKGEVRRWEDRGEIRGPIRVRRGGEWDEGLVGRYT